MSVIGSRIQQSRKFPLVFRSSRCFAVSPLSRATEGTLNTFIPQANMSMPRDNTIENNIQSETNRLSKTLTKFWEKVDTVFVEDKNHYELRLDLRTLRTPLGFPLTVPAEKKQLAYLIQHEWSTLPELKIKLNSMPLSSLACRSIDLHNTTNNEGVDPELVTKVGKADDIKLNLLRYFDTDTCLIFTTKDEYEGKLRARQNELYLPLIAEFEDYFTCFAKKNHHLTHDSPQINFSILDCETDGLRGNKQPILVQAIAMDWMSQLSMFELVALEKAVLTAKSFLCGVSLLRSNCSNPDRMHSFFQMNKHSEDAHFQKTVHEIVELGNLETIFQTNEWGEVEDTHDVDKVDWLRNLTSAALVAY